MFENFTNLKFVLIGKNNNSHLLACYIEEDNSSITIGNDNLFSWGVELRCSDSHTILDENKNPIK